MKLNVTREQCLEGMRTVNSSELKRIGVSIEEDLLHKFDQLIDQKGYLNRSEALRDMMRDTLLEHSWDKDEQLVSGSILLFYDHHKRNLTEELTRVQHESHDLVLATTHFHLDHDHCLEMIVVKGKAKQVQALKDKLASLKGVTYSGLTLAPIERI